MRVVLFVGGLVFVGATPPVWAALVAVVVWVAVAGRVGQLEVRRRRRAARRAELVREAFNRSPGWLLGEEVS